MMEDLKSEKESLPQSQPALVLYGSLHFQLDGMLNICKGYDCGSSPFGKKGHDMGEGRAFNFSVTN